MIAEALRSHFGLAHRDILDLPGLTTAAGLPIAGLTHDNADPWGATRWERMNPDKSAFRGKRVILLTRDPRDVVVSFYFQSVRRSRSFDGSISEFIRHPRYGIRKVLAFQNIWHANLDVPDQVLHVTYESLHATPHRVLRGVLDFLGARAVPDGILAAAVQATRLEKMRALERRTALPGTVLRPLDPEDAESFKVRRGKIGGYADYLSPSDLEYVEAAIAEMGDSFGPSAGAAAAAAE